MIEQTYYILLQLLSESLLLLKENYIDNSPCIRKLTVLVSKYCNLARLSQDNASKVAKIIMKMAHMYAVTADSELKLVKDREKAAIFASRYYYSMKNGPRKHLFDLNFKINYDYKMEYIGKVMENAVKIRSPFVICSYHHRCRESHIGLQGKVYYDDGYKKYLDTSTAKEISEYIKNHHLMSIQTVTSAPYYLVSGLNCKHYFINITIEEATGLTKRTLIKKYALNQDSGIDGYTSAKAIDKVFYRQIDKSA